MKRPGGKLALVEVKSTHRVAVEDVRHLLSVAASLKGVEAYCLSNDPNPQKIEHALCLHWKEGIEALFG